MELTIHGYVFQACYGVIVTRDTVSKFPHLFKPLPWWEKRERDDLPRYISVFAKGRMVIDLHSQNPMVENYIFEGVGICIDFGSTETNIPCKDITPADESEYQEYQKQKQ